ncbi:bifunctional (p)ppGpp synthetase/guanosine-3',5'-bis(diphosphate) 3'-pyrophosphohydrolase [Candidatus Woesearchaeota archaeon]|nr:bifunctional (p)ppGpp synthetase/guanosine-3',5'-bis(diphosphate) 3'-pyrophosphohydrolase [Candidatus Woesearchaeota archaeon]
MLFRTVLKELRSYSKDTEQVEEAYKFAAEIHKMQKRASGEAFIQHPLNVAYILAKLRLDTKTITAALLHDTIEDSNVTIDLIKRKFGNEVTMLVNGVTKLTELKVKSIEEHEAENIRKMLMASTKDIRVIIIKLADKLHNMRTLKYLTKEQQERIAKETLNIYAPLAYRLGMATLKWELEDLSFKYLEPDMYIKFKEKFGKKRSQREQEMQVIVNVVEKELKRHGIKAKILGRPKHFYSIYRKMITKHRSFEELHDLIGLRIIVESVEQCYEVIGIIHNIWKPIPGEFNDYIAMPKANLYQSLHTAVIALNQPVEFQIRTIEMDKIAEEGIAAHWKYKGVYTNDSFDKKLSWLKEVLDFHKEAESASEFVDYLKVDFFSDEIYVFTPKGKVIPLPKDSSPIDFAYAVHTSIGERCIGAIVNGRIVPLRHELRNGDIVNILTAKMPNPKRDWLKMVKTTKAKSKIMQFIRQTKKIPIGAITSKSELVQERQDNNLVEIKKVSNPIVKFARCCHPIPDEEIVAYNLGVGKYSIHGIECNDINSKANSSHRIAGKMVPVYWKQTGLPKTMIRIIAYDRVGLLADILNTVAATGTNVNPATAKSIGNDLMECSLGIVPEDIGHLKELLLRIKKINNVKVVYIENIHWF